MTDFVRQYALALFSLAKEQHKVEDVSQDFYTFLQNLDSESKLFFSHPSFHHKEKKAMIESLKLGMLLQDFLKVLIDNERFAYLEEIYWMYVDIVKNQHQLLQVTVVSKTPLAKAELARIKNKLEKDYNRKVAMEELIDQSIIAGYILKYEGYEMDDTVSKRLQDLALSLKKN